MIMTKRINLCSGCFLMLLILSTACTDKKPSEASQTTWQFDALTGSENPVTIAKDRPALDQPGPSACCLALFLHDPLRRGRKSNDELAH